MKENFYWIKIKKSLLLSKKVRWLISQDNNNGYVYVLLYQALHLTGNSNGIIYFSSIEKLTKSLKIFPIEKVENGIRLLEKLKIIQLSKSCIKLTNNECGKVLNYDIVKNKRKENNQKKKNEKENITKELEKSHYQEIDNGIQRKLTSVNFLDEIKSNKINSSREQTENLIENLLIQIGYVEKSELTLSHFPKLIELFISKYGYKNTYIHTMYFLDQISELLPTEEKDEEGKIKFKRVLKNLNILDSTNQKYAYFKKAMENGFKKIGGDYDTKTNWFIKLLKRSF